MSEQPEHPEFQAGDGATVHLYTDAHAYTVIDVSHGGKRVTLQQDTATLDPSWKPEIIPGGFAGHCVNQDSQRWTYETNPDGAIVTASLTKRGWRVGGQNGQRVTKGRRQFHDYNF